MTTCMVKGGQSHRGAQSRGLRGVLLIFTALLLKPLLFGFTVKVGGESKERVQITRRIGGGSDASQRRSGWKQQVATMG